MSDKQKSFWTSLPGILTGVAAIITAITGLYLATGPDHTEPPESPVPEIEPDHKEPPVIPEERSEIFIEAKDYQRTTNVRVEVSVHGKDFIQSASEHKSTSVEYDIMFPDSGKYRVWILYASAVSRPVKITFNGQPLIDVGLQGITGGWGEEVEHWKWSRVGAVYPQARKNTLKLYKLYRKDAHPHANPFPHIKAIKFEPID
jgi:hypothetical protein